MDKKFRGYFLKVLFISKDKIKEELMTQQIKVKWKFYNYNNYFVW